MTTLANDHVAVRVTDIERSTRFYVEAFGAEILTNPFVLEGEFAETMMSGPRGTRFMLRQLRLTEGVIELFQFLEPAHPARPLHASEAGILHMGFQVDDVAGTAARVEQAGGRLLMPVTAWGAWSLTFCADPDGNVIEIADASIHDLIRATIETFPEARPGTGER